MALVMRLLLSAILTTALAAQTGLTYSQLRQFIRSSVDQRLKDKDVAAYLKRQVVRFSISDRMIEEFVGWGIGPRSLKAIEALQETTRGLPPPTVEPAAKKVAPTQPPPPSGEEQRQIVEHARSLAEAYTEDLPNYVCLQITRRFFDPTGTEIDWLKLDEIKTRVSYIEGKEDYENLSVDGRLTGKNFSELGGTTSTGEFGTILASLFDRSTDAEFRWARHSLLRGHPVYVFHVEVPKHRSSWTLTSIGNSGERSRTIRSGFTGLVYIGKESGRVLRIVMEAKELPSDFPMNQARSRLDFDFIDLSGQDFLLPLKAQAFVRTGRLLTRNDLEFRLYRKFTAEATITFEGVDDLEPLPEDDPEPQQ